MILHWLKATMLLVLLTQTHADYSYEQIQAYFDTKIKIPSDNAINELKGMLKKPEEQARNFKNNFELTLKKEVDKAKWKIDMVKQSYAKEDKNIGECLDEKLARIAEYPIMTIQNVNACIGHKILEATKEIETTLANLTDLWSKTSEYYNNLNECKNKGETNSVSCRSSLEAQATLAAVQLPAEFTGAVSKVISYLACFSVDLNLCSVAEISTFILNTNSDISYMIDCATKKYPGSHVIWERIYETNMLIPEVINLGVAGGGSLGVFCACLFMYLYNFFGHILTLDVVI